MSTFKNDASPVPLLNSSKRLIQFKQAALSALQQASLDWSSIRFLQLSDACTFKIEHGDGIKLLRLHPDTSLSELKSELAWLEDLHSKVDFPIPHGIPFQNGELAIILESYGSPPCSATLMQWVEGSHSEEAISLEEAFREGELIARLHEASEAYQPCHPFDQSVWGFDSFQTASERFFQYASAFVDDQGLELYCDVTIPLLEWLKKLPIEQNSHGIIHADLHQGNILFHEGQPRPIDFGRCGFGFYMYDLVQPLLGLPPDQRQALCRGYASLRPFPSNWITQLERFFLISMIENYAHHGPNPAETESMREQQPYALAMIKRYLDGQPFLFEHVPPYIME
ncbi:phosphotransferase enzyme family protein [Paenibacillus herberti]|uniref:Serine kinase n=1 Tax=Paenibacillus herberti TaxID=1619309 RepID=A0A229P154_9BACL|nr:phosphotransferase [Paenibacillus herberti]OXM15870.1 serine kinase [Paenibacillus herberti]